MQGDVYTYMSIVPIINFLPLVFFSAKQISTSCCINCLVGLSNLFSIVSLLFSLFLLPGCAGIDHNRSGVPQFATCSTVVDVWDYHRSEPIHSFEWGCDAITTVAFNPAQSNLLASTGVRIFSLLWTILFLLLNDL